MGHRILLADDSLTIQKVIELTFAGSEWELRAVGSGDRAISLLNEFAPDIVLADAVMPGVSGYELCEAVKNLPDGRFIPVVILTGTFEPFDRSRADRAGADAVVTKPFDSHALQTTVGDLVARAQEEKAAWTPPPPPVPEPEPLLLETGEDTSPTGVGRPAPAAPVAPSEPPPDALYATTAIPIFTPEQIEAMRPPSAGPTDAFEPISEAVAEVTPEPFREEEIPPSVPAPDTAPVPSYEIQLGGLEEDLPRRDIEADIAEFERSGRISATVPGSGLGAIPPDEVDAGPLEIPPPAGPFPESAGSDLEVLAARTSLNDLTRMVGAGPSADRSLSDDEVERIARRVVEILGERVVRKVAWDVVPEMAERLVRERLRELERAD